MHSAFPARRFQAGAIDPGRFRRDYRTVSR